MNTSSEIISLYDILWKDHLLSALLYYSKQDPIDLWADELRKALPEDIELRPHPDIGDPAEIEFAL